MDAIFTLLIFAVLIFGVSRVFGAIFRSAKAVTKTVMGKGSLGDNFGSEFKKMGSMKTRIVKGKLGDTDIDILKVECEGLLPITSSCTGAFITSLHSVDNDGKLSLVKSFHDKFSEPNLPVYQHITPLGELVPNTGWKNWVNIATIPLDLIQPARGGDVKLLATSRLVDVNNMPEIVMGYGDMGLISFEAEYTHHFNMKGWFEEGEDRKKSRALSVKIAMAVAMADGTLDDSEGATLKKWIQESVSLYENEETQKELKGLYNAALKESHKLAKEGNLALSEICKEMNEIGEMPDKIEAIELAYKVMSADGVIDKSEMEVINKVAKALDIDPEELERLRDQELVNISSSSSGINIEELLDIDSSWSNKEIKAHLAKEFQKWNNRLNTLEEGDERDNAQKMLDYIAEARKKYG